MKEECRGCDKHWFNGVGLEMCDNDWNCRNADAVKVGERVHWKEYGQEHSGYLADTYEIETRGGCMRMAYIAQSEAGAQYYWDWGHGKIEYAGNPLELKAVAYGALYKE